MGFAGRLWKNRRRKYAWRQRIAGMENFSDEVYVFQPENTGSGNNPEEEMLVKEEQEYIMKYVSYLDENEIDAVEVNYYVDTYKWVTVEYELTAEDIENLERSDYNISEGADEDSENQVSSAVWVKDGVRYELISLYNATPADMLFEMAEELIRLS